MTTFVIILLVNSFVNTKNPLLIKKSGRGFKIQDYLLAPRIAILKPFFIVTPIFNKLEASIVSINHLNLVHKISFINDWFRYELI